MLLKQLKVKQTNKTVGFFVLLGTLGATLLGSMLPGVSLSKVVREHFEQLKLFDTTSSFNWLWNLKVIKMSINLLVLTQEILTQS